MLPRSRTEKLTIIDWNLSSAFSHNWDLFESLGLADPTLTAFVNRCLPEMEPTFEARLHRIYSRDGYQRTSGVMAYPVHLVRSLCHLFSNTPRLCSGVYFLQDCGVSSIPAYWLLAVRNPGANFLFYFHTIESRKLLRIGALMGLWKRQNATLASLNPRIAQQVSSLTGQEVHHLPLAKSHKRTAIQTDVAEAAQPFHIVIPGFYRADKCMATVGSELVSFLEKDSTPGCIVSAGVQYWEKLGNREDFKALAVKHQFVSHGELNRDEFVRSLERASLIVLPYLKEAYRDRISAIAEDALALGKPFVITEGTLSALTYEHLGSCLTFPGEGEGELTKVLCKALTSLALLEKDATEFAAEYVERYRPSRILEQLLSITARS